MQPAVGVLRRTYRYRLYPTAKQRLALEAQLGFACALYNAALEQRRYAWRMRHRSITLYEQFRDITDVRAHGMGPPAMTCHAMRDPIMRVDRAIKGFIRRTVAGERAGFPRFRSRRRYDSLTWDRPPVRDRRLVLAGVGHIKVRWHRPLPADAEVRTVTVRRKLNRWFVYFSLRRPRPSPRPPAGERVGVDLGIDTFAALSNGEFVPGPRPMRFARRAIRIAQRRLARRQKGSVRRRIAGLLLARSYERLANARRDHAFKVAANLTQRFDVIYVEDLNVKGLSKSRLAREVHDQAWGVFLRILADKAEEAGRYLIPVDARNTSQACSKCGRIVPKQLKERIHRCACGYEADRDVNAARNIYRLGESRQASTWPAGRALPEKEYLAASALTP